MGHFLPAAGWLFRGGVTLVALWGATSDYWCREAWALTLSTPTEGAVLRSGEMVPVAVEVGKDVSLRSVKYFWYRADEEPLASHQAEPAPFSPAGAPFSGTVRIPAEALGTMRLLVVGEVTRGRLAGYEDFDEVLITVEPAATLTSIEFAVEKPWRLDTIGQRVAVPAVGQFADGVLRLLTSPKAGSTYRSSDESVVQVDAAGIVQVMGNGKARITVEHRGKSGVVEVQVDADADAAENHAPIARVVSELHVKTGSLVVLDGLRSSDPDGDPLRYSWKQIRGHRVPLSNVNEAKATFVAPPVSEPKSFQFALTVMDMAGPDRVKGAESLPATITVLVRP